MSCEACGSDRMEIVGMSGMGLGVAHPLPGGGTDVPAGSVAAIETCLDCHYSTFLMDDGGVGQHE